VLHSIFHSFASNSLCAVLHLCLQDGLAEKLPAGEVVRRIREAPFVQIPLGVTEDRLVGTVDIEASMKVRGNTTLVGFDTCCEFCMKVAHPGTKPSQQSNPQLYHALYLAVMLRLLQGQVSVPA
jgi:hypothetical protein